MSDESAPRPRGPEKPAPAGEAAPTREAHPHQGAAQRWATMLGLHPLVAFGMIACDFMLFGGEAATAGVGLTVTVPIAIALVVPCLLLQRFSYGDDWGSAVGKAMMVGVLTAIPFPIGSPVTLVGGVLGLMRPKAKAPALPEKK